MLFSLLAARVPATSTSFLSSLPPGLSEQHPSLRSHIRSLILFDPPSIVLSALPPADMAAAVAPVPPPNPASADEFGTAFAAWAASASGDTAQLESHSFADVLPIVGPQAAQADRARGSLEWGLAASAEETAGLARAGLKEAEWPAGLVYGSHSVGSCVEGAGLVLQWWEEARREARGEQPRRVRVVQGGTHFAPVLEPEEFAEAVMALVDELRPVVRWF